MNGLATAEAAHGHTTLLGQQMWHAWRTRMLVHPVKAPHLKRFGVLNRKKGGAKQDFAACA
jgi:hypothetical protein